MAAHTVTVSGYMHLCRSKYSGDTHYSFFTFDASKNDADYVLIGPHVIEYTLPEGFNATAAQIASLQAQRDEAAKQFAATVRAIDEQIGKLTAIGCDVEGA